MGEICELLSAGIIEKDTHKDVLWTWSYPTISNKEREILLKKCCLTNGDEIVPFIYSQYQERWFYIFTTEADKSVLKEVTHFSLILATKDFNPEKYVTLCGILAKLYNQTGNPADLLEKYLSVVTRGLCKSEENGMFVVKNYDADEAYLSGSVRDVINRFEIETILIYSALLLKRKVIVYHTNITELLNFVRVLPCFVWHRQNWNILYPYMDFELEVENLPNGGNYVVGCSNAAVESRAELYDLFVNLSTGEISIASHAKDVFAMGKLHKDLALSIVNAAKEEKTEKDIIKDISIKTTELLNNLKALATSDGDSQPVITIESLRERKMPQSTENFLLNLAEAEGLLAH